MTDRKSNEFYIEGTDDDAPLHDEILATEGADEITALQSARWVVAEGLMTEEEAALVYGVEVTSIPEEDSSGTSRFVETGEGLEIEEA